MRQGDEACLACPPLGPEQGAHEVGECGWGEGGAGGWPGWKGESPFPVPGQGETGR